MSYEESYSRGARGVVDKCTASDLRKRCSVVLAGARGFSTSRGLAAACGQDDAVGRRVRRQGRLPLYQQAATAGRLLVRERLSVLREPSDLRNDMLRDRTQPHDTLADDAHLERMRSRVSRRPARRQADERATALDDDLLDLLAGVGDLLGQRISVQDVDASAAAGWLPDHRCRRRGAPGQLSSRTSRGTAAVANTSRRTGARAESNDGSMSCAALVVEEGQTHDAVPERICRAERRIGVSPAFARTRWQASTAGEASWTSVRRRCVRA